MTFYYVEEDNELVGNNMFYEGDYGPLAERDGDSLVIDVTEIMEEGRGVGKLREMKRRVEDAIEANEDE